MKKIKVFSVILQGAVFVLLLSCSNSERADEKGAIEEKQEEIAQDLTNAIKDPINKAKAAAELANQQARQTEDIPQ